MLSFRRADFRPTAMVRERDSSSDNSESSGSETTRTRTSQLSIPSNPPYSLDPDNPNYLPWPTLYPRSSSPYSHHTDDQRKFIFLIGPFFWSRFWPNRTQIFRQKQMSNKNIFSRKSIHGIILRGHVGHIK